MLACQNALAAFWFSTPFELRGHATGVSSTMQGLGLVSPPCRVLGGADGWRWTMNPLLPNPEFATLAAPMGSTLVQIECVAPGFWVLSLLFVKHPTSAMVVSWHLVTLGLSFAAAATLVFDPDRASALDVLLLTLLGVGNGLLASAWCGSINPALSKLPMLGITLAGFLSALFMALTSGSPSRLF